VERKIIKKRILWSREAFSSLLGRVFARTERSNQVFSVVEFGIGDFETNMELGKRIFQVVAKELRSTDEVGWLKYHHIGVLLYDTSFEGARIFSERICSKLLPNPPTFFGFTIHTFPIERRIQDDANYQVPEGRQAVLSSLFAFN